MAEFSIKEILDTIPHRYPFLMIDKILELRKGEYVKAVKNVTMNEPFFQGHYPDNPIMPGVMIVEAIAQAASFLALKSLPESDNLVPLFAGIEKARFKTPVGPGDTLIFEVTVIKKRSAIWWAEGIATVDGKVACKASIQAAFGKID